MAGMDAMKRQSLMWYNDALTKAGIRDLSGAMSSLESALHYDPANLKARDLLGLIQYARGQVPEALSTWILTRAMSPRDALANYFINSVQAQPDELQAIDMAIRKYNQGLRYCRDGNADLAVLQLAEAVEIHPGLLCAWQLLALIYLTRRQYAKARKALLRARGIDEGDELTLTYWHELKKVRPRRIARQEAEESGHSVSYMRGRESIIRPLEETERAGTGKIWTNIIIGLIMGAALVFLLVGPLIRSRANKEASQLIAAYTDKIAAQEAQIDALKTELEDYRRSPDAAQADDGTTTSTKDSYELLMKCVYGYNNQTISHKTIFGYMLEIDRKKLGEEGQEEYDKIAKALYPKYKDNVFAEAKSNYESAKYEDAIKGFQNLMKMDEKYHDGEGMLYLANAYAHTDNKKNAKIYYKLVIKNNPDSAYAKAAQSGLDGKIVEAADAEKAASEAEQQTEETKKTEEENN